MIGFGVYNLIQILFYYLYYWPKMNIDSFRVFKSSFIPGVATGAIAMLSVKYGVEYVLWFNNGWIEFFTEGTAFTLLYVMMVYFFVLNKSDKVFFLKLIKRNN